MDPNYRPMIAFLRGLGTEDVPHSGDKGFLAHLVGVYRDMEAWGGDRDLCRAALFHSIYGTELFRQFALPLERRGEVRALIGERAERIAFVNCLMDRSTFDALLESDGPYRIRNRETGGTRSAAWPGGSEAWRRSPTTASTRDSLPTIPPAPPREALARGTKGKRPLRPVDTAGRQRQPQSLVRRLPGRAGPVCVAAGRPRSASSPKAREGPSPWMGSGRNSLRAVSLNS